MTTQGTRTARGGAPSKTTALRGAQARILNSVGVQKSYGWMPSRATGCLLITYAPKSPGEHAVDFP